MVWSIWRKERAREKERRKRFLYVCKLVLRPYHKYSSFRQTRKRRRTTTTIWFFYHIIIRWDWLDIWSAKERNPTFRIYTIISYARALFFSCPLLKIDAIRFLLTLQVTVRRRKYCRLAWLYYLLMKIETTWMCVRFLELLMRKNCHILLR